MKMNESLMNIAGILYISFSAFALGYYIHALRIKRSKLESNND